MCSKTRMQSLSRLFGLALAMVAMLLALPHPSHGETVTAVDVGNGVMQMGAVGPNILPILPTGSFVLTVVNFNDAFVSFTGTMLATDVAGTWIYNWGSGTATDIVGGPQTLAIEFTQTYRTIALVPAVFNDVIVGRCAGGTGVNSGAIGQMVVNATGLSVLTGNCTVANPFGLPGLPVPGLLGALTTLTGTTTFQFTPGSAPGSAITLPWGEDFPDPSIPGDAQGFIDPNNIPSGFIDVVPEPGTIFLAGGSLCLAGLVRKLKK